MREYCRYRALTQKTTMRDWVAFQFGTETVMDYGKRVIMHILGHMSENSIALTNAHGICFDERGLCKLIGETSIIDDITFETLHDMMHKSRQGFRDESVTKEDIEENEELVSRIQAIDVLMWLLKGHPDSQASWNTLRKNERFDMGFGKLNDPSISWVVLFL